MQIVLGFGSRLAENEISRRVAEVQSSCLKQNVNRCVEYIISKQNFMWSLN